MVRYKITEDQLRNVFENLEYDRLKEMDDYNYPSGSDISTAPWNQNDDMFSNPIKSSGDVHLLGSDRNEFLLKNKSTGSFIYTTKDNFEDNGNIYDILHDYLEIPQQEETDEDGTHLVDADDWKDSIDDTDLGLALANYINDSDAISATTSIDEWENGSYMFLEITKDMLGMPDINGVIYSTKLLSLLRR